MDYQLFPSNYLCQLDLFFSILSADQIFKEIALMLMALSFSDLLNNVGFKF